MCQPTAGGNGGLGQAKTNSPASPTIISSFGSQTATGERSESGNLLPVPRLPLTRSFATLGRGRGPWFPPPRVLQKIFPRIQTRDTQGQTSMRTCVHECSPRRSDDSQKESILDAHQLAKGQKNTAGAMGYQNPRKCYPVPSLRLRRQRWCKPIIPALGRLSQEDYEFKASLSYIMSSRLAGIAQKNRGWEMTPIVNTQGGLSWIPNSHNTGGAWDGQ